MSPLMELRVLFGGSLAAVFGLINRHEGLAAIFSGLNSYSAWNKNGYSGNTGAIS